MKKIHARKLLQYSTEQLWDMLTGEFILIFDDGEIETNDKETLYSSYAWNFHREYETDVPLLKKHHVKHVIGNTLLGSGTHLTLLGNVMWSVYDHYITKYSDIRHSEKKELDFRDKLARRIYELTNEMYNDLTYRVEEYVVSLDITDFIECLYDPQIAKANQKIADLKVVTERDIQECYREITTALKNGINLPNNPISLACRANIVSMGQVNQCLGPRGVVTDMNSDTFPIPIRRGYVQGIRDLAGSMIESRSAAKSLLFSKQPLQQSEYFSRRLQLTSQITANIHNCDCGSTEYLIWHVRRPEERKGIERPGDLPQLVGCYYMDDDGQLKIIRENSYELIGRTIKLRNVIHCSHPDPYGVCSTCFGEMFLSLPEATNLGQICATSLASKNSQNTMSLKHLDGSASVEGINIEPEHREYLKVAPDGNSYMLADELKGKIVQLVLDPNDVKNITDIFETKKIEDINITHVTSLVYIGFNIFNKKEDTVPSFIPIEVSVKRRLASITLDLLKHIKKHKWTVDSRGNYIFDLTNFDWSKSILTLPLKHINTSDHARELANMLESSVDKMQERDTVVSPDAMLKEFYDLVMEKLEMNLAPLSVVLYSAMIVSAASNDYSLPKTFTDSGVGVMKLNFKYRSIAAVMAFQDHREIITSPTSYIHKARPNHVMDGLICPTEVFG